MGKITQSRVKALVSHPRIPSSLQWDTISGGEWTHNNQKARPSAGAPKEVIPGESERGNLKTTTMVDPATHGAFLDALHAGDRFEGAVVARQIVDSAGIPVGNPLPVQGCSAEQVTFPDGDANNSDLVKVEIEWAAP